MSAPLIHQGKVRDLYDEGEHLLMVTSDRLSAFDRAIAEIPHKGEVLNRTSEWWFEQTAHIIPNHMIECPSAQSMRVKKCEVFPIECVVRGYLTGSTVTSIWMQYQQGERQFFSTRLPDGLKKNTILPQAILTPTTKEADHDRPLTEETLNDWIGPEYWQKIAKAALKLFAFGQKVAAEKGLILVDTKYEFGLDSDGQLCLVDECHTPDSSRYWRQASYPACLEAGEEPESFDKEFVRLWYANHCDPYQDEPLPKAPDALITEASKRYTDIYEQLTGRSLCAAS